MSRNMHAVFLGLVLFFSQGCTVVDPIVNFGQAVFRGLNNGENFDSPYVPGDPNAPAPGDGDMSSNPPGSSSTGGDNNSGESGGDSGTTSTSGSEGGGDDSIPPEGEFTKDCGNRSGAGSNVQYVDVNRGNVEVDAQPGKLVVIVLRGNHAFVNVTLKDGFFPGFCVYMYGNQPKLAMSATKATVAQLHLIQRGKEPVANMRADDVTNINHFAVNQNGNSPEAHTWGFKKPDRLKQGNSSCIFNQENIP